MSYYSLININNNINEHNLKIKFVSPNDHDIFISKTMTSILNNTKKHIETHCDEWNNVKKLTNPYEYIHTQIPNKSSSISKIKPLSRAFFKLIEICKTLEIFDEYEGKPINTFHLAEGPGGFIEAVTYMRFNKNDRYYGMTLIDDDNEDIPGWKKTDAFLKKNPNVIIETGKDKTGNLYSPKNYKYCVEKYKHSMDFITGDGGFDFSINYNKQEALALRLIITQIAYAMVMQSEGGTFVLKVFDQFTHGSMDVLYFLSSFYSKTYIFKPNTSRIANSERYIVCQGYQPPQTPNIFHKFFNILQVLNNINFKDTFIHRFLDIKINYYFIKNVEEINAIIGQKQISNILSTLRIIQNKEKKGEKINAIKNKNIKNCIKWCVKYNIPHNKYGISTNIFMSNKQTNYFTDTKQ
jgi:23S rRNA U2552 (ribose-2'-O)-methylase RlmE/FtsJ